MVDVMIERKTRNRGRLPSQGWLWIRLDCRFICGSRETLSMAVYVDVRV